MWILLKQGIYINTDRIIDITEQDNNYWIDFIDGISPIPYKKDSQEGWAIKHYLQLKRENK